MKGLFQFLGTGASAGSPMVGCSCEVCISKDSRNSRLRPSCLLNVGSKHLVIDTGPDFRYQVLRAHLKELDGVLITHTHFDHIAGIDELRAFYLHTRKPVSVLVSKATQSELLRRFDYLFREKSKSLSLTAQLQLHVLENARGQTTFLDVPIQYLSYTQSGMEVTGFRFGTLAYISDIKEYEETIFEDLKGVHTLILSAIRKNKSSMHFTIDEAVAFSRKVQAKQTWLMHISHEMDHEKTNATLPPGICLAYDGLELEFEIANGR